MPKGVTVAATSAIALDRTRVGHEKLQGLAGDIRAQNRDELRLGRSARRAGKSGQERLDLGLDLIGPRAAGARGPDHIRRRKRGKFKAAKVGNRREQQARDDEGDDSRVFSG